MMKAGVPRDGKRVSNIEIDIKLKPRIVKAGNRKFLFN